jgi:hypothetical protein
MAKKTGKPKKTSTKIAVGGGALAQLVFFLGALLISVIVFSYIAQGTLEESRNQLKADYAIVHGQAEEIRAKIATIPNLDNDIRNLISQLEDDFKQYYGNVPQERLLYAIHEYGAASGIEIDALSFSKDNITEKVTLQKEFQDSYSETQQPAPAPEPTENGENAENAQPVQPEPVKFTMDVQAYNITVGISATYKDLLKFLDFVAKSEKTIAITGVSVDQVAHPISVNETGIPTGYLDPAYGDAGFNFPNATAEETDYESMVNNNRDLVSATVNMLAFFVPSIDKYVSPEDVFASVRNEMYGWEFKQPAVNPFSVLELLDSLHKKQKIYDFNKDNYPELSVLNADPATILSSYNAQGASIMYAFSETAANPQITLNVSAENILFEEGMDRFGMEMYSDGINDAMVYATFIDANNRRHNVKLASAITWKGNTLIDAKLPNAPFPLRLSHVSIVQMGEGADLESGLLSFRNVYAEKRETPSYRDFLSQNQQEQPAEEPPPQEEPPAETENPPEVTF